VLTQPVPLILAVDVYRLEIFPAASLQFVGNRRVTLRANMSDDEDSYVSSEDEDFVLNEDGDERREDGSGNDSDGSSTGKRKGKKQAKASTKKKVKDEVQALGGIDVSEVQDVRAEAEEMYGRGLWGDVQGPTHSSSSLGSDKLRALWAEMQQDCGVAGYSRSAGLTGEGIGSKLKDGRSVLLRSKMAQLLPSSGITDPVQVRDEFLHAVNLQGSRSSLMSGMKRNRQMAFGTSSTAATAEEARLVEQPNEALRGVASAALAAAQNRKVAVNTTVMFAGQKMEVTKLMDVGTQAAHNAVAAQQQAASKVPVVAGARTGVSGALTRVIATLDKPDAISTLEKTSLDWDTYKYKQGIDDELTLANKDGYVDKQEFLQRVDARAEERAAERRAAERREADRAKQLAQPPTRR
jgi:hypothetical protein